MKGARRKVLFRWILYSLLGFVALFVAVWNADAAVTGKIAGQVVDANTGEPLVGANVVIVGTDRGAACDIDGYYFISRLEPGSYSVQARMMGYKNLTLTNVKVISGHTTPVNFEMETTVVEGEGVVVQADREIIKIDLSSSSITAGKTDIQAVPLISSVADYLNYQAGIDGWSVRGSGMNDTKLMADGLLLVDQRINEPILMPSISEIKEVSLIKGGMSAEFSNARAGIINVVTREGSTKEYEGTFEFRYTPGYQKHKGPSLFDPANYYNDIYFRNKLDTGIKWYVDFFKETDTIGCDTVVRLDSVCWYGPRQVWGDPNSPFYDTVKLKSSFNPNWNGWFSEASGKPITPEALRDLLLWRRRINPGGDTLLPNPEDLFSIYSDDSAYIPIWDIEVDADGDTTWDLTGFTRAPYTIPEDQPRIGSYGDKPDWSMDAGFGGPIPILGQYLGDMTFYASYRDYNETFPLPDSRDYYRERQMSLKLTSRFFNNNVKINAVGRYGIKNTLAPFATGELVGYSSTGYVGQTYLRNAFDMIDSRGYWAGRYHGSDKIRSKNISNVFNLNTLTPFEITARMYGLSLQHALSEKTFYDVKLTYIRSNNDASYYYDIPSRMNDTVLIWFGEKYNVLGDYITDRNYLADYTVDNIPYGFPNPDFEMVRVVGTSDLSVWGPAHNCGTFNQSWSQTYNARVDFTSQINKYNEIKSGIEVNYDRIHEQYALNEGMQGWDTPGMEFDPDVSDAYITQYDAYPILAGFYIKDKIEFEGMYADLGLRLDYSDPNVVWPDILNNPYSAFFTAGMKDQLFDQDSLLSDVPAILKLSPRVGISFPVLENSKLFFNFGHFYSVAPNEYRYLVGMGAASEPLKFIGNPRLDMARTIAYEVGFESNIADMFLARITGYYKDMDGESYNVGYSTAMDQKDIDYTTFDNLKFTDTRGFEFELRKDQGRFFTGWVIYEYRVKAEGFLGKRNHYSYMPHELDPTGFNSAAPTEYVPEPVWNVQATFKTPPDWGMFLGGYNLSLLYTWKEGRYETINFIPGEDDPVIRQQQNYNIQWQDEVNLDLSLSKSVSVAGTALTLFVDVHNVFDWQQLHAQGFDNDMVKYLKSLHLEMWGEEPYLNRGIGNPPAPGEEPDKIGDLSTDGEKRYMNEDSVWVTGPRVYINDPDRDFLMYLDPRYVQFGVRFSF